MHPFTSRELARTRGAELYRRAATRRTARLPREREPRKPTKDDRAAPCRDFFAWVQSLPWVVERPYQLAPGVRTFAVDCPALAIRRLWLVTGMGEGSAEVPGISIIVPSEISTVAEREGWGRRMAGMPAGQVLMSVGADVHHATGEIEERVLLAYWYAMV
jgi:hypothetical protein